MPIGLWASKLEGSMEEERSFSVVNLPFGSIKAEMGIVKIFLLEKCMGKAATQSSADPYPTPGLEIL